jgi:hypothetical protein
VFEPPLSRVYIAHEISRFETLLTELRQCDTHSNRRIVLACALLLALHCILSVVGLFT